MVEGLPQQRGLYDPRFEHDACGIGFVAQLSGAPSHDIVAMALTAVGNMAHRGGVGADGKTGDGAGVLTQIPRAFFARELDRLGVHYPVERLAVGMLFLPSEHVQRAAARQVVEQGLVEHGLTVLGWRVVPVERDALGANAQATCPSIEQVLVGTPEDASVAVIERMLYVARKAIEAVAQAQNLEGFSVPSLSIRTIIYKGLLVAPAIGQFYPDLRDPLYDTALAVYHQRYSTNTFPTWHRAQPFHMLSHNGEINTLQGNVTWMRAREAEWRRQQAAGSRQELATGDCQLPTGDWRLATGDCQPAPANCQLPTGAWRLATEGGSALAATVVQRGVVVDASGSDSAMLDNVLELLVLAGRDIRHALTMLVPEAWERVQDMDPAWRAFYQYHAGLMEPWDGPAALAFCDGDVVGLALDRNGLRPARYLITDDGLVVCGSEVGAVHIDPARIVRKGKVGPGQMIAVDLRTGQFEDNATIKSRLAAQQPYKDWLGSQVEVLAPASALHYSDSYEPESSSSRASKSPLLQELQRAFGYTAEELAVVLKPMMTTGQEPIGSMGDDTATAVFSEHNRPLYNYFKQHFAEVTNPPIDPLREELVMSLTISLGRRGNLLEASPGHAHLLRLSSPVLNDEHLACIRAHSDPAFASATLRARFPAGEGPDGLRRALDRLCKEAEDAIASDKTLLIISDRGVNEHTAPVPALLALGAVHQHLTRLGLRTSVSLIVESGEPREVHHLACLIGMGAEAVNPYVALATVRNIAAERSEVKKGKAVEDDTVSPDEAEQNFIHALEKGLLKIMSKMGISTVDSYCGAQIFEAVGLADDVIERCFTGVPSRLGGISFGKLAANVLELHDAAFADRTPLAGSRTNLPHPGFYKFKKDGEYHAFSPPVVHALQKAANGGDYATYKTYSKLIHSRPPTELRDLLDFTVSRQQSAGSSQQPQDTAGCQLPSAVSIDEVEPVESIVRRFSTAAMSHGSTSLEAHQTLSIAMNRLGGLSNSGEGGEDPARFTDERNSTIKQVASGRFGVTPAYLASAKELQIKMAQGSKPGEGGQLPGHKVTEEIARIRHTTPGVQLISPPPHHDIYSIEDLAQLIFDLKQVNPRAAVSVKLVSEAGVGTIAAGVAKGGADVVMISGQSGGTGASPLSSIKNAGVNWELGLAETQQTLVLNGLRGRVRVRVDGGIKTGRDVVMAAMIGADEFSFGTAALVAEGCIMARACHSNTCPVGIATQKPELRAKFTGTPEQVVHFFLHLAQEVREVLASVGARALDEVIGRADMLRQVKRGIPEADSLNLSRVIERVNEDDAPLCNREEWNGLIATTELNLALLRDATPLLEAYDAGVRAKHSAALSNTDGSGAVANASPLQYNITNSDRTVGATLSGAIGAQYGNAGLPDGTITAHFTGSAGQSFGAFLAPGVRLMLQGEANDYVGKGMGGGEIVICPPQEARYATHENTIVGNTVLYGATGGALFAAGQAGERFAVRNSGAVAVVEGVGDHGCEYMTGGVVVVLGSIGRNFAAGMTGGLAYVFDEDGCFDSRCNTEFVGLRPLDAQDDADLRALIQQHGELTGSSRAADLLQRWDAVRGQFWRIHPRALETVGRPAALLKLREGVLAVAER